MAASKPINDVIELLKAEEAGRLIKLPCKVGDTIWYLGYSGRMIKQKIEEMIVMFQSAGAIFRIDDIGDRVWLSEEEASAANRLEKHGADIDTIDM